MLITKIINKIFRTTLIMFLILTVFTITNESKEKVLRTNLEINNIKDIDKTKLYLLSNNNYLVETNVYINSDKLEDKINKIIEYLKINNNKIPKGLKGYLLKDIKINNINLEDNNIKINFSKEILNIKDKELVIEGLVYSLLNLDEINSIEVLVENNYLENYEYKLNKNVGINKQYILKNRKDVNKINLYYYNKINNIEYLTPVTKYINDKRKKIEIILDELINNIPNNLISYIDDKVKLKEYKEENDLIILKFNENFIGENKDLNKKIINQIALTIFENYDVNTVLFQENDEKIEYITKK